MQEGDKVSHKKLGIGKILRIYPKNKAARVEYESGHVTTNSQSRIRVIRDIEQHGPPTPTQPASSGSSRRRGASTSKVDYGRLERARQAISAENLDADHVVPRVYGLRVYCEVWRGGYAKNVFYAGD